MFPFLTRAHHNEVVKGLRNQIIALAKLLYPEGVPEEFQLLLGVEIPQSVKEPAPISEPEAQLTPEQMIAETMENERAADQRKLTSIARTKPSLFPIAQAEARARDMIRRAKAANPGSVSVPQIFDKARKEVIGK